MSPTLFLGVGVLAAGAMGASFLGWRSLYMMTRRIDLARIRAGRQAVVYLLYTPVEGCCCSLLLIDYQLVEPVSIVTCMDCE